MFKVDLSDIERSTVANALELLAASITRKANACVSGSAIHTAFVSSLSEVRALQSKLFSLKG